MRITPQQREKFDKTGVLHLPGFFDAALVAPMAELVWQEMARRHGIVRERPESWNLERPAQFQALERKGGFDALLSSKMRELLDSIFPGGWTQPAHWGQLLVTFPGGAWDVPHAMWHVDHAPSDCLGALASLSLFTFLDRVHPRQGGTLYVEGAHRVILDIARRTARRIHSPDVRNILAREQAWFSGLFGPGTDRIARFMNQDVAIGDVRIGVREMTGAAGDLILMHPAMLHCPAPNGLDAPRLMLVQRIAPA